VPRVFQDLAREEIDRVLESVDLERPYRMLRLAGSLFAAFGWILLAAVAVIILSTILTVLLAKPLPVTGLALVEGIFTASVMALLLLAASDFVDWLIDSERHARETNLMLEGFLRGRFR
jgi:uncharacterized membrane protein YbhN (UPF0104 family)